MIERKAMPSHDSGVQGVTNPPLITLFSSFLLTIQEPRIPSAVKATPEAHVIRLSDYPELSGWGLVGYTKVGSSGACQDFYVTDYLWGKRYRSMLENRV
jgi:hypothetical protein